MDTTQISVRKRDNTVEALQLTKILLSLAQSGINHDTAVNLEATIRDKLMDQITSTDNNSVTTKQIATITYQTLAAYDVRYGDRYRSYCEQLD